MDVYSFEPSIYEAPVSAVSFWAWKAINEWWFCQWIVFFFVFILLVVSLCLLLLVLYY